MYTFVDFPQPRTMADYLAATERFVDKIAADPGVLAVYQLGSVSDPGISDLDFLVVTGSTLSAAQRPLAGVPSEDRYLITHAPYGIEGQHLTSALRYSCFHNYRHLWGEQIVVEPERSLEDEGLLERQIAFEYLVQMYVALTLQREYKVFKTRGFFLHVKALLYDLDFLGETSGPFREIVERLVRWRRRWFVERVGLAELGAGIEELYARLPRFVERGIARHGFWLPREQFRLAPNISLELAGRLEFKRRGLSLPHVMRRLGRKYFSLQNRLNRFAFGCPFEVANVPAVLEERFDFLERLRERRANSLPGYMRPTSSLNAA